MEEGNVLQAYPQNRILKSLKNPPNLDNYNFLGDPNEHVEHVETKFNYYRAYGIVKCNLFVMILKRSIMI